MWVPPLIPLKRKTLENMQVLVRSLLPLGMVLALFWNLASGQADTTKGIAGSDTLQVSHVPGLPAVFAESKGTMNNLLTRSG